MRLGIVGGLLVDVTIDSYIHNRIALTISRMQRYKKKRIVVHIDKKK